MNHILTGRPMLQVTIKAFAALVIAPMVALGAQTVGAELWAEAILLMTLGAVLFYMVDRAWRLNDG